MNKKKKTILIISISIIALAAVIAAVIFYFYNSKKDDLPSQSEYETVTVQDIEVETKVFGEDEFGIQENESGSADIIKGDALQKPDIDIKKPTDLTQHDITLNDTIKIKSLAELDGRLCVIVENISTKDIEFARISFKAGEISSSFKIVALMSGQRAILICDDDLKYDEKEYYVGWNLDELIYYSDKPQMHSDRFEVTLKNGEIVVKNKKLTRAKGPIFIVYQRTSDGINICSEARRIKIDKMKMREETTLRVPGFNPSNCKVIFVDYGN